jgi:uncharacterized repeat protein (TIGR02543 family)
LSLSPQNIRDKNVFYNVGSNAVLQVPMISLAAYIVADGWKDFYSIIGGSTLTVTVNNSAWGSVTGTTGGWQPANSAVTLTAIPAQGYAFESWTSGGMILGTSASFTFTLIQDIPIVANFKPYVVYVVVAFDTRGGSAVASQEVASGSSVAKPANPTRSGYTFAGWYKDDALTDAWNFASAVTANVTLYAKWNAGSATGVESAALGAAKAYPNPTTGAVTIEGEGAEVLLYSLSGELLKRTRGSVVDLSGYPSGIYLLKAGGKTARVVKQ